VNNSTVPTGPFGQGQELAPRTLPFRYKEKCTHTSFFCGKVQKKNFNKKVSALAYLLPLGSSGNPDNQLTKLLFTHMNHYITRNHYVIKQFKSTVMSLPFYQMMSFSAI